MLNKGGSQTVEFDSGLAGGTIRKKTANYLNIEIALSIAYVPIPEIVRSFRG